MNLTKWCKNMNLTLAPGLPGGSDSKESAAMQETLVRFLSWEDLLEKGMAAHSSILAWRIPQTESVVTVQLPSHVRLFVTPWTAARQGSLSSTISLSLLTLIFIESVMPSNYLILCRPLLLLPSIFPSIRGFSNVKIITCKLVRHTLQRQNLKKKKSLKFPTRIKEKETCLSIYLS